MSNVIPFVKRPIRQIKRAERVGLQPSKAVDSAALKNLLTPRGDWFLFACGHEVTDMVCAMGDVAMRALLEEQLESVSSGSHRFRSMTG